MVLFVSMLSLAGLGACISFLEVLAAAILAPAVHEPNWLAAFISLSCRSRPDWVAGVDLCTLCGGSREPAHPFAGKRSQPSMQQATDEHAALHAMCAVLSPASYSDFRARIHKLFVAGEVQGALALALLCGGPVFSTRPGLHWWALHPVAACARRGEYQFPFVGVLCRAAWSGLYPSIFRSTLTVCCGSLISKGTPEQPAMTRDVWWAWRAWHPGR